MAHSLTSSTTDPEKGICRAVYEVWDPRGVWCVG